MNRGWLAVVVAGAAMSGACATNLLVGADTEGGTAPQGDTLDDGVVKGTTDVVDGPSSGTEPAGQGVDATAGDTTAGQATAGDSTAGDTAANTGTDTGVDCAARTMEACAPLPGCTWLPGSDACVPTDGCALPLDDCVTEAACVWVGLLEGGACHPGSCGDLEGVVACEGAPQCAWQAGDPGVCVAQECGELPIPICEPEPTCALAGHEAAPECLPAECLEGACVDLGATEICVDNVGCHLLGEPGNGTCVPVDCVGCAALSMPECDEAPDCTWNAGPGTCVQ